MVALVPAACSVIAVLCCLPQRRSLLPTRVAGAPAPTAVTTRRPSLSRAPWRGGRTPPGDRLLEVLDMVAAQVRAGAAPLDAWLAAADLVEMPSATPVPDPTGDLVRWAGRDASAAHAARGAAAAWRLAARTGAPLGDLLDSVCATVRAERADRAAVEAALAGPRATSRLLLALPVAGIGLGELIGAAPVHVLLATGVGRPCLVGGAALLLAGHVWMRRLVAAVEGLGGAAHSGGSAAQVMPS